MQKQIKARCRKQVLVATTLTSSLFGVSSSTSPQHLPALHHPAPNSFTPGLSSECTITYFSPKGKESYFEYAINVSLRSASNNFSPPKRRTTKPTTCSSGSSRLTSPEAQQLPSRCPDCRSSCAAAPAEPRDQNMSRSQHSTAV